MAGFILPQEGPGLRPATFGWDELGTSFADSASDPEPAPEQLSYSSVVATADAERSLRWLDDVVLIDELDSRNVWCEFEAAQPELLGQFPERFVHGEVVGQQLG